RQPAADDPRGDAGDDAVGRNVARDDGAGADHGAAADGDPQEDAHAHAQVDVVLDHHPLGFAALLGDRAGDIVEAVLVRDDQQTGGGEDLAADLDAAVPEHLGVGAQVAARADADGARAAMDGEI